MHPARRHFSTASDFLIFDTRLLLATLSLSAFSIREISVTTIQANRDALLIHFDP